MGIAIYRQNDRLGLPSCGWRLGPYHSFFLGLLMNASSPNEEGKTENKAKPRGFAAMSPERQRAIARIGGIAAHKKGTAHEFTSTEASAAGRKGGLAVSKDQLHMALIGRKGGLARKRSVASDEILIEEKSS